MKKKLLLLTLVPVGLIALALLTVYVWSSVRLNEKYEVELRPIDMPVDAGAVERGKRIAVGVAKCVDCHGANMAGSVIVDDPALGRFAGPNLTAGKGGLLNEYTNDELARAIRYGLRKDGTPARFMPAGEFVYLADSDTADLIAYLRSLPPVDNTPPTTSVGPLGRILFVTGNLPMLAAVEGIDLTMRQEKTVQRGPTEEYGRYLIATGGCTGCHGMELKGGPVPGVPPSFPPATNIRQSGTVSGWTEADFIQSMRIGIRPSGVEIHPFMPFKAIGTLSDDDLKALWKAMQTYE